MSSNLSITSKKEVLAKVREKYNRIRKKDKSSVINNLVDLTGYDRKYIIVQLNKPALYKTKKPREVNNLKYNEYIQSQLVKVWYASNKICSKRPACQRWYLYCNQRATYS